MNPFFRSNPVGITTQNRGSSEYKGLSAKFLDAELMKWGNIGKTKRV